MPRYDWLFSIAAAALCACVGTGNDGRTASGNVHLAGATRPAVLADSIVQRADSLVRAGSRWRLTLALRPFLSRPNPASPEARLVGARAAAAWDGWSEVQRLLLGAPWLDRQLGGEGRELVARSWRESGERAVSDARLAMESAPDEATKQSREVLLARAHDRANARDSAAFHYMAAAGKLPRAADWLRLRAAGVTADSAARAALFAKITLPPARTRIVPTDAQARERSGDLRGAAEAFHRAGDEPSAFRVEALAANDASSRAALVQRILSFLQRSPNAAETRQAIDVLDRLVPDTTGSLIVARAAAAAGVSARAVTAFARVASAAQLTPPDRMLWAGALARLNRPGEAARVYATLLDDSAYAPAASYQRARMQLLGGDGPGARSALRAVIARYPTVREAGAPAFALLADLQMDDGDLKGAAQTLHDLVSRHPDATQAPLAGLRAALLSLGSSAAAAAASLDSLALRYRASDEGAAVLYWAGRAHERAGRATDAKERWKSLQREFPLSYYAVRATSRLREGEWRPPASSPDSAAKQSPALDSAVQRIVTLRRLGMDVEARFETDALAERAEQPHAAAPVARALAAAREPALALRVDGALMERGASSPALLRVAYPILHEDALLEESRRNSLDPALVAGLIRQESGWNPRADSVASARGLMQLLPSVGNSIASRKGYPHWSSVLLFEPDANVELGTAHLAASLHGGVPVEQALAAYNAGGSRVTKWSTRPGADDPELWTEWIPFVETRDYVRIVTRNAAVYRALYRLGEGP